MDRRFPRGRLTPVATGVLVVVLVLAAISGVSCTKAPPVGVLYDTTSTLVSGEATTTTVVVSSTVSSVVSSTTTSTASSSTTATAAPITGTTELAPSAPLPFSSSQAMRHIERLAAGIGIRPGGSPAEDEAVTYAYDYLAGLGYDPVITDVPLPNGKTSHNVVVIKKGASPLTVLVSGHLDTKKTTPGGNDDASGAAAVLELARDVANADVTPTIVFALFGNEEIIDSNKTHHHYGSRSYVANMMLHERENLVAMISLDMIAYGKAFNVRTMGKGPLALRDMLQSYASANAVDLVYLRDDGPTGWSDHEPFERAGYPAVWFQWLPDPTYHQAGDTYQHCNEAVLRKTGRFLLGFLTQLSQQDLDQLHTAVRR